MRAFARDTGGAIAVMTALVMPVLIGVAAYAIDASLLLARQERLQIAADVGAWAGAELLRDGRPEADVIAFARAVVAANADVPAGTEPEITVTIPDPARIEVAAVLGVERIFSRLFGTGALEIFAASGAVIESAAEPQTCVYLDDPRTADALYLFNGTRVTMTGCNVVVASSHSRAVNPLGGTRLQTDCLTTAGGVAARQRVFSECPGIRDRATVPLPDPLPAAPHPTRSCAGLSGQANAVLARFRAGDPSCGDVFITGNENLPANSAGVYFVSEGNLNLSGTARLTLPPGSVLVLMDTARITMNTISELVMTAPDTGPLSGIAILAAQDPPRTGALQHSFGELDIEGLIALPGETVWITGDVTANRCTRIRAGTLSFTTGRTQYAVTCAQAASGSQIRLVPNDP